MTGARGGGASVTTGLTAGTGSGSRASGSRAVFTTGAACFADLETTDGAALPARSTVSTSLGMRDFSVHFDLDALDGPLDAVLVRVHVDALAELEKRQVAAEHEGAGGGAHAREREGARPCRR